MIRNRFLKKLKNKNKLIIIMGIIIFLSPIIIILIKHYFGWYKDLEIIISSFVALLSGYMTLLGVLYTLKHETITKNSEKNAYYKKKASILKSELIKYSDSIILYTVGVMQLKSTVMEYVSVSDENYSSNVKDNSSLGEYENIIDNKFYEEMYYYYFNFCIYSLMDNFREDFYELITYRYCTNTVLKCFTDFFSNYECIKKLYAADNKKVIIGLLNEPLISRNLYSIKNTVVNSYDKEKINEALRTYDSFKERKINLRSGSISLLLDFFDTIINEKDM